MDVFAPDGLLQEARDVDAPALVDVGGGIGTDVIEFRRRYPQFPGRIILQELAGVIASAKEQKTNLVSEVLIT